MFVVYKASCVKEHAADLRAIRIDCNEQMLAVREHHDQMEENQRPIV